MEVLKTHSFAGPNRWSPVPTAEMQLEAGIARDDRSAADRNLRRCWLEWLPHVRASADAACRFSPRAKRDAAQRIDQFIRVLELGATPGLILAHAVRALQLGCGVDVGFVAARETDDPAVELAAVEFEEEVLLRGCIDTAVRWCRAAIANERIAAPADLRQLVDLADDARLGPSSLTILRAAANRGIPYRRLGAGSLVQLGEGKLQRRIWTAETDATSAIAESIAQDKELTKRLLRQAGVPVPHGRIVSSPEDAWVAAGELGIPVVVKPRKANHARGVSLNLTTREEVARAYDIAVEDGDDTGVIVEQYIRGQQHRLLVIGQRLVAAARGESEYVEGDGQHTIRELAEIVNRDPRRGENYTDSLELLKLNESALIELVRQGLTPESIPTPGQRVLVQQVGDLTIDCTSDVHPDNIAHAVLAARVVGLDIAGMDVVAEDIRRPLVSQRGAILEVNAGPSIGMHVAPLHGRPQPVGEAVIELLFPDGQNGRIVVMAVAGDGPRAEVVERIEQVSRRGGKCVARATTTGVWLEGKQFGEGRTSDAEKVAALLSHPDVEVAVWESQPEEAWSSGLGCERVDVAIVTPASECPTEQVLGGIRAVVHAVPATGLLIVPCDFAAAADLAASCRGAVVYVARAFDRARLSVILDRGDRAIYVRDRSWVLARSDGEELIPFDALGDVPDPSSFATLAAVAARQATYPEADSACPHP